MNSYLFGFLISLSVVLLPLLFSNIERHFLLSLEAIVIVLLGTIGVAFSCYPFAKLKHLTKVAIHILKREVDDSQTIAREIIEISRNSGGERIRLANLVGEVKYHFLKESVNLLVDKLDDQASLLMEDRIRTKIEEDQDTIAILRNLSKFPPALGLLATVLSLIGLLSKLSDGQMGASALGPAMATGLVGTLYGIIISNLVLLPMAENLALKLALETKNRNMVMIGVLLIAQKCSPLAVQEAVNSMLAPSRRVDVLGVETTSENRTAA